MFRIAVCDDEPNICTKIHNIIRDNKKLKGYEIDIEVFHSGESMFDFIESKHSFDLILLDIELEFMNGVEVGRKIRQEKKDEVTQILYISAKQSYAMELFDNRPLSFLIKPIDEDKLTDLIEKAIRISDISCSYFEFKHQGMTRIIQYKDILCFTSEDKQIQMQTNTGTKTFFGKLDEIEKELYNNQFIRIHKSTIVNYQYISKASYDHIILTTGDTFTISQRYRISVREKLNQSRKSRSRL